MRFLAPRKRTWSTRVFLRLSIFATDRWDTHTHTHTHTLSPSLRYDASIRDVKLIGKERSGSYNNTSTDVPKVRCEKWNRGIEYFRRRPSSSNITITIVRYDRLYRSIAEEAVLSYIIRIRYTPVESIQVDPSSRIPFLVEILYYISSLSAVPFPRASLISYSTLKIAYVLSCSPARLFYLLTLYTREH